MLETREVTSPDVAVSPDGATLVFSMLGHLFQLREPGGEVRQLTFGSFYDESPAFSPDGSKIAFASDRGAGEANLFILDRRTGEITQVTDEYWAARPAWSPDGSSLAYLSYAPGSVRCAGKAGVRRVPLSGGPAEVLTDRDRVIRTVDFDPTGSLVWLVEADRDTTEVEVGANQTRSHIERALPDGRVEVTGSIEGRIDQFAVHPEGGYLAFGSVPWEPRGALIRVTGDGVQKDLLAVTRRNCVYCQPRFDLGPKGEHVYLGDEGKLWRVSTTTGNRVPIPLIAQAEIPVRQPVPVPQTDLRSIPAALNISYPSRSADGSVLVFGALAKIWLQRQSALAAEPLSGALGIERLPALSPDGRLVAFVASKGSQQELVLVDLESGERKTLATRPYIWELEWRPDGGKLFVSEEKDFTFIVTSFDVMTGEAETVVGETGEFYLPPRPHFSADGGLLYFSAYRDGKAQVYGLDTASGQRSLIATLPDYLSNVQVSPGGGWIGFCRNNEVWLAPLKTGAEVSPDQGILVSVTGGRDFGWDGPDRILYTDGELLITYEIDSRERHPVSTRLAVTQTPRPTVLVERARLLDFETGSFSDETTLLVRNGIIQWIGDSEEPDLAADAVRLDAEGRYVIPGLIEPHNHIEAPWWSHEVDHIALLANGITTMRDVGEPLYWAHALDQRSRLTGAPLPRYLFSGEMLNYFVSGRESGGSGYAHSSMLVFDETTVREAIRKNARGGAQLIKAYASLPMSLHRVAADEARRLGLPVMAHGGDVKEATRDVMLGYGFIEHLPMYSQFHDDLQQLMAQAGSYWTPTLSIMGGTAPLAMPEEELNTARGRLLQFFQQNELASLQAGRQRGVKVLIGTDNMESWGIGVSMHREMRSFVLAGYSPLEALRMATRDAAVALGIERSVGVLANGKLADFVILEQNPLDDIANTQTIWRVVKDGRVFDPATLVTGTQESMSR